MRIHEGSWGHVQRRTRGQEQRGALRAGDWGLARQDVATWRERRRSPVSGPERPAGRLTVRIVVAVAGRGFASALLLIIAAFLISMKFRELGHLLLAPGDWLVQLSNWFCPPLGVECTLGSKRQGMQHIWQILCAYAAWSALFSAAWWCVLRRARPPEHGSTYIFLDKGKGMS